MLSLLRNAFLVLMLGAHARADTVSALPESLVKFEAPAFPNELKNTSVLDGYATLALSIQPDGAIDDTVVLGKPRCFRRRDARSRSSMAICIYCGPSPAT